MPDFIKVEYRNIDGAHVFTSDEVPGLYIADADPREAFDSVSEGIGLHFRFNEKRDVSVQPDMSAEDFLKWIGAIVGSEEMGVPHPSVLVAKDLIFRPRA